jgi:hypothetical protein
MVTGKGGETEVHGRGLEGHGERAYEEREQQMERERVDNGGSASLSGGRAAKKGLFERFSKFGFGSRFGKR